MTSKLKHTLTLALIVLLLAGCGEQATPTPAATLEASATPVTAPTDPPTAAPTATATATPTSTPRPTIPPTQAPTPTETPTETPTAVPEPTQDSADSEEEEQAPPPQPPTGNNLLTNPSFEGPRTDHLPDGWIGFPAGWGYGFGVDDHPTWLHSGGGNLTMFPQEQRPYIAQQRIYDVVPGATYRFGAWGRLWSSTGLDRDLSEDPAPIDLWVCISVDGRLDNPMEPENAVCSASGRPYDTWQYLSVDAVAQSEFIVVSLVMVEYAKNTRNIAIWDDASLTAASTSATPTPVPAAPPPRPTRPAPIPFDANALYDAMVQARSDLEQIGGLLDRTVNDGPQPCESYMIWYDSLITSPAYDGVLPEWSGVYSDYVWSVEHLLSSSAHIADICIGGGSSLSNLEYGLGRIGINESLERLYPAVESAAAMLGR